MWKFKQIRGWKLLLDEYIIFKKHTTDTYGFALILMCNSYSFEALFEFCLKKNQGFSQAINTSEQTEDNSFRFCRDSCRLSRYIFSIAKIPFKYIFVTLQYWLIRPSKILFSYFFKCCLRKEYIFHSLLYLNTNWLNLPIF